ncbi:MAG: purine-nucleoside phosphorylase [Pedosphaera sp.]|nr:purine-nucleoside phosphorylase [Pedosphaera sp.]
MLPDKSRHQKPVRISPAKTAKQILCSLTRRPRLAIVLGSGLGDFTRQIENPTVISYSQLAGFKKPAVRGHAGQIIAGDLSGLPVTVFSGRSHYYEGHSMAEITFPVRVMAEMGIDSVLFTNSAGAINRSFKPGDLMIIRDHINFIGDNPLRGAAREFSQPIFVDLTNAYDLDLARLLRQAAGRKKPKQGIYLALSGPNYETPAEIVAFRKLGADAVGMSTVPEVIVARQCGLRVAAISCITNMAAGIHKTKLNHEEVIEVAGATAHTLSTLISQFARLYAKQAPR